MPCTSCNQRQQRARSSGCPSNNTMPAGTAYGCNMPRGRSMVPMRSNPLGLRDLELATSYVVPQIYTESYTPEQALARGTCFPELDMPMS